MSVSETFAWMSNGTSLSLPEIPESPIDTLTADTASELGRGGRLCAWFGVPNAGGVQLISIIASDSENALGVGRSHPVQDAYDALTARVTEAHLFEREVCEQYGIVPQGHPWLKPVRRDSGSGPAVGKYFEVAGGEVHEVAVGPVHAGIIEPGHFRFQCAGEEVLHLEIALGYQHRGIENALIGGPHRNTWALVENAAGDSTVAHATAHALVVEALSGGEAPLRGQWVRAIGLELERLANHIGDLGALANDVAFLPTSSACGRVRGELLNLTAAICGNRFGRGLVRAGGCRWDLEQERIQRMLEALREAIADVSEAANWFWDSSSVRARLEAVGSVSSEAAAELGLVGPAARACGLVRDVRYDHPAGWHRFAQIPVAVWPGGDAFARARVRSLEIQRSGAFVEEQLMSPPDEPLQAGIGAPAPDTLAVALVEGWRGETCHVALTGPDGRFLRYKIIDPSFHNWPGLALAMRGQAISDFPICNKSFNLSYCGFDL